MNDDLFQSVSQRSIGAQDAENRIEAVADELRRRCKLYEAQRRDGQSHVSPFEAEQRAAENFAKEYGLWIPMEHVFDLGHLVQVETRMTLTFQTTLFIKSITY